MNTVGDYILRSRHTLDMFGNEFQKELVDELKKAQVEIINKLAESKLNTLSQAHLKAVLAETTSVLQEAYASIDDKVLENMSNVAKLEYNNIANAIRSQAGLDKILKNAPNMGLPANALRQILSQPISGWFLKDWTDGTFAQHHQAIKHALTNGLIQGHGMQTISRNISKATNIPINRVSTLARTSIMEASNKALREVYNDYSDYIKGYRWLATLDHRTCLTCAIHDGEYHREMPEIKRINITPPKKHKEKIEKLIDKEPEPLPKPN